MDPLKNKYTYLQRLSHQFQRRRDIPFRKKFFVGYDLAGNTYWEFTIDGNMQRLRRKLEPFEKKLFKVDYFKDVPPQWLQWLRRTREHAPTLEELINDQVRQQKIKVLAAQADEKWHMEKQRLEQEQQLKLERELQRAKDDSQKDVEESNQPQSNEPPSTELKEESATPKDDPWAQADASKDTNPITSSSIKPRK